eukprot:jgi/Mesvir1/28223/Mv04772-RA.1
MQQAVKDASPLQLDPRTRNTATPFNPISLGDHSSPEYKYGQQPLENSQTGGPQSYPACGAPLDVSNAQAQPLAAENQSNLALLSHPSTSGPATPVPTAGFATSPAVSSGEQPLQIINYLSEGPILDSLYHPQPGQQTAPNEQLNAQLQAVQLQPVLQAATGSMAPAPAPAPGGWPAATRVQYLEGDLSIVTDMTFGYNAVIGQGAAAEACSSTSSPATVPFVAQASGGSYVTVPVTGHAPIVADCSTSCVYNPASGMGHIATAHMCPASIRVEPSGRHTIKKPIQSPWNSRLCGCCDADEDGGCHHACLTSLCPCWVFGQNAEIIMGTNAHCACATWTLLWPMMWLLGTASVVLLSGVCCIPALVAGAGGAYPASVRFHMRTRLRLRGGICEDFMLHCCCVCCAISQEARELRRLGYTTRGSVAHIDGCQGARMQPPPTARMLSPG